MRRTGLALRRQRTLISTIQWAMVAVYAALVLTPALLPQGHGLARLAQFLSWGLWWPLAILSVMLLGRAWCGLLCPEGTLSEWASQRGQGRPIPPWVRWGGWPLCAFLAVTLYGQLADVYVQPLAALLLLGGTTATAVAISLLYGRGKRVWCRYLCPVTGVFGLLAKLAPVHFRVDRDAWDNAPRGRRASGKNLVECAPLIDIRRMESASDCNMCGRCAGERDAVQLAVRSPHAEILSATADAGIWPARLLVFGVLGLATATFLWPQGSWAGTLRQHGLLLSACLATTTLLLGGWLWLWLRQAALTCGLPWPRLAAALIPFAGLSLCAGLSLITTDQLAQANILLPWTDRLRGGALAAGALWSLWLTRRLAGKSTPVACLAAGLALPLAAWWLVLGS